MSSNIHAFIAFAIYLFNIKFYRYLPCWHSLISLIVCLFYLYIFIIMPLSVKQWSHIKIKTKNNRYIHSLFEIHTYINTSENNLYQVFYFQCLTLRFHVQQRPQFSPRNRWLWRWLHTIFHSIVYQFSCTRGIVRENNNKLLLQNFSENQFTYIYWTNDETFRCSVSICVWVNCWRAKIDCEIAKN